MKAVMLLLTPMIARVSYERWRWLAWRVWWHALAFVTHEITWHRAYVALSNPQLWKIWCHLPTKSTKTCHNEVVSWTIGTNLREVWRNKIKQKQTNKQANKNTSEHLLPIKYFWRHLLLYIANFVQAPVYYVCIYVFIYIIISHNMKIPL